MRGISAGNDQTLKLSYAPRPERNVPTTTAPTVTAPAATAPAATAPAATAPGSIAPGAPATTPAPAATTPPPAGTTPPATAAPTPPAPGDAPIAATGTPRLLFNPSAVQTQLSSAVTVQLSVENVQDLFAAPVKIQFDPKVLRLTSVRPGSLLSGDGQKINFSENTLNDVGEASVVLNRVQGTGSVSGSGALLNLTFQAVGKGNATVSVVDAGLKNSQLLPIAVPSPSVNIVVQ